MTFVTGRSLQSRPLSSTNGERYLFVPRPPLSWPAVLPSALRPVDHGRATLSTLPHRFIPRFHPRLDTPSTAPPGLELWNLLLRVLDFPRLPEPVH